MEKAEVVNEVVEELEGKTLNKAVVVGAIVVGGALAYTLVPKAVRRIKRLFAKRSNSQAEELDREEATE